MQYRDLAVNAGEGECAFEKELSITNPVDFAIECEPLGDHKKTAAGMGLCLWRK